MLYANYIISKTEEEEACLYGQTGNLLVTNRLLPPMNRGRNDENM